MIYYDRFETWEPSFSKVVEDLVGKEPIRKLAVLDFEFIEDAGDFITHASGIKEVSTKILDWIHQNEFCVFHGTRLLPNEFASISDSGLMPLVASQREERLRRILCQHKDWKNCEGDLANVIEKIGPGKKVGAREGQIHFSLSRSGLVNGFDHYLAYGSEFDQRVSQVLFGNDTGLDLLRSSTSAYLVHVKMTGEDLVAGAHPFFSYEDVIGMGEVPGLGSTFLNAWAFKMSRPDYELDRLRTDCCMVLKRNVFPEDVVSLEKIG